MAKIVGYCIICWSDVYYYTDHVKLGEDIICGRCAAEIIKRIFEGRDLTEALKEIGFDAKRVPEDE